MQHLIFPGQLIAGEEQARASEFGAGKPATLNYCANPKQLDELAPALREKASQLPSELLELMFLVRDLPAISSPAQFPPNFPVEVLPSKYQESESLSVALWDILRVVDPEIAAKWHWRDVRKVRRSVEIPLQTGRTQSEIIADQRKTADRAE